MQSYPQQNMPPTSMPPEFPSGKNKIGRIGEQTKGLVDDFTSWVELRLKLFQVEIQDKIQAKISEAAIKIAPFVAAAISGFFVLITAALFIGWWLGHPAWGFLVITSLLVLVTMMLGARSSRLKRHQQEEKKEEEARKAIAASTNGSHRLPPSTQRI